MTDQHRATPEQWTYIEENAWPQMTACFLELRARVELLEATQHAHIPASSVAPAPTGSLVERVALAIAHKGCFAPDESYGTEARAAIREVAAWLRSEYPNREGYGTAWANLIEDEANR